MTPRDRRVLLIGAAVVVGGVLGLRAFPAAVKTLMEERGRLAVESRLLRETEAKLAQRKVLEDSALVLNSAVASMGPHLLAGPSAAAALSDLNARLGASPGFKHARIAGLTSVPDSSRAGPLRRLSAELHVQTDFRGLAELLGVLVQEEAMVVVERMRVTAAEPVMPEPVVEQLEVEVLVTGWYGAGRREGGQADGREGGRTGRREDGSGARDSASLPSRPREAGDGLAMNPPSSRLRNAEGGATMIPPSSRRSVDDLIRFASRNSPFRVSRRPASLRFGEVPPPAPPPAAPKPVLLLTGILWGREPAAIVEGVPGQEGAVVVRGGEMVGAVRVIRVERARVLLSGFDTTWTLTVRQPWQ